MTTLFVFSALLALVAIIGLTIVKIFSFCMNNAQTELNLKMKLQQAFLVLSVEGCLEIFITGYLNFSKFSFSKSGDVFSMIYSLVNAVIIFIFIPYILLRKLILIDQVQVM